MAENANTNVTPISADSQLTDQQKRDQLRARIEAGEKRNQQRGFVDQAKEVAGNAVEFAKQHPVATVAGAVVLGLAIGAMTRRGRNFGRNIGNRGGAWANYASEAALAYALAKFEHLGDRMEDLTETAEKRTRAFRHDAAERLENAGDFLRASGRKISRSSSRAFHDLGERFSR